MLKSIGTVFRMLDFWLGGADIQGADQLGRAATEYYSTDTTKPSVTISWLGEEWYVSICRYERQVKHVVVHHKGKILAVALAELAQIWASEAESGQTRSWKMDKPSLRQIAYLKTQNLVCPKTKGEASSLISKIIERKNQDNEYQLNDGDQEESPWTDR